MATSNDERNSTVTTRNDVLTGIAGYHLDIATLETRKSDRLDFHEVSVWGLKAALNAAYEAGFTAAMDHMPAVCNDCKTGE